MSVTAHSTSQDGPLEEAFGTPVEQLHAVAAAGAASPALYRAMELRSFLAVAEQHVAQVRDTIHDATSADRDPGELSVAALRFDVQWLQAALDARDSYTAALGQLLRTMPRHDPAPAQPVPFARPQITTTPPPAVPAPVPAGAERIRRP